MLGAYSDIQKDVGELGSLRRKMEESRQKSHASDMQRSADAFRKATGGMDPTAANANQIRMLATVADDPAFRANKNRAVAYASALRGRNYTPGARTGVAKYTHEWLSGKNSPPAGVPSGLERFRRQEAKRKRKNKS